MESGQRGMPAIARVSDPQVVWIGGNYRQPPERGFALWFPDRPAWTVIDASGWVIVTHSHSFSGQKALPEHVYWTEAEAREDSVSYLKSKIASLQELLRQTQGGH